MTLRLLLVCGWQVINIGDVAHTPGALHAFQEFGDDVEIRLWLWGEVDDRERAMFAKHFPDVTVIDGGLDATGRPSPQLLEEFERADILVHGPGPLLVARDALLAWRGRTKKPYGIFGVTFDPIAPYPATLTDLAEMVARIDGQILSPTDQALLAGAEFIYCRDSLSVDFLERQQVGAPIIEFGPDATVMMTSADDAAAEEILATYGLAPGNYLCLVPRMRYSPYHDRRKRPLDTEDHRKSAITQFHLDRDMAFLADVATSWVRETGRPAFVVPEMTYAVALSARFFDHTLAADVADSIHVLPRFWSVTEAVAVYERAAAVVSMECHSPLLATAVGTPAIYIRQPTDTIKGQMYHDLGLVDEVHEIDDLMTPAAVATWVSSVGADPSAARARADEARSRAWRRLAGMVESVQATAVRTMPKGSRQ
ncbi:polysaccharide pyruvyl transferase family protein [Jiangella endophytica]|uniref:polysaccharide pyruvyl transferase family protein n=1 Tax=Jiangella endophytica TaxID=1623398 RepID=UPI001300A165|nr:polysaccharide pyruvyl transferase family protein [Jiangella endophytica]